MKTIEEKLEHYQRFFLQMKRLRRNQGRSAMLPIILVDELINKYFIEGDLKETKMSPDTNF